jgi:hypothetical protein
MTESEIKQLAEECSGFAGVCFEGVRDRYIRIASALEQMQQEVAESASHLARMREALANVEWVPDGELAYCPCCKRWKHVGHNANCKLKAALSAQPATTPCPNCERMREAIIQKIGETCEDAHKCGATQGWHYSTAILDDVKKILSLSPAQPARETPAERKWCNVVFYDSEILVLVDYDTMRVAHSVLDQYAKEYGFERARLSISPPVARIALRAHAVSETPPCPPGHCDDCTGECPDGPPAELSPAASEQAPIIDDPDDTRMMLLSALDTLPDLEIVSSWTPEQRKQAEEWAASLVAVASDHGGEPLPMPGFLRQYKKSEQAKEDAQ